MPNNYEVMTEYVESKITQCALEERKHPHSFALGALQYKVAMMLSRLELFHPEAYITAVEEFSIAQEGTN